jgi:hypothetical protein
MSEKSKVYNVKGQRNEINITFCKPVMLGDLKSLTNSEADWL